MLNQLNLDAVCAATYLENYLEFVESLPDEIQRHISDVRRLDALYYDGLSKIQELRNEFAEIRGISGDDSLGERKKLLVRRMKNLLAEGQMVSDEKLKHVSAMVEILDEKSRRLDEKAKNLDVDPSENLVKHQQSSNVVQRGSLSVPLSKVYENDSSNVVLRSDRRLFHEDSNSPSVPISSFSSTISATKSHVGNNSAQHKRARRQKQFPGFVREAGDDSTAPPVRKERTAAIAASVMVAVTAAVNSCAAPVPSTSSNKRRRKAATNESSVTKSRYNVSVDPDEPTYCLCEQVSYGEMIGCDNNDCEIEWFHFNCVGLTIKPKGKWFCPNCRGERQNVMKD